MVNAVFKISAKIENIADSLKSEIYHFSRFLRKSKNREFPEILNLLFFQISTRIPDTSTKIFGVSGALEDHGMLGIYLTSLRICEKRDQHFQMFRNRKAYSKIQNVLGCQDVWMSWYRRVFPMSPFFKIMLFPDLWSPPIFSNVPFSGCP